MADGRLPKPVISSACPAVVRLIRVRFPDLCDHVLNLNAPMEVSAMMAKRAASENGHPDRGNQGLLHHPVPGQGDGY